MKPLTFILCLLIPLLVQAEIEFKIITLQHRFASDLLPTIEPMVGAEGTATGMQNKLILRASHERMLEIELIVAQLDVARVNRRITVNNSNSSRSQQNRFEGSGNITRGNVTVGNDRNTKQNSANIDITSNTSSTKQNSSQFLNVLDGEQAFIRVGQSIPYSQEWITITSRYTQLNRTTDWQNISTGFAVRPRTIGNQVELEITPRIAQQNSHGYIDFQELSTILHVSLGEWVDIGATMQKHDDISRKILGFQDTSSQLQNSLVIKVD